MMDKKFIKTRLHEALVLKEKTDDSGNKPTNKDDKKFRGEYNEIQDSLEGSLLKKSRVMGAAGLGNPKDAGDRRAFNAKLDREENENGTVSQFDDEELAQVSKVVANPKAFFRTNQDGEKGKKTANKSDEDVISDIQTQLDDSLITKAGVMKAAGLGDPKDAGDRKAFNAKLDREENDKGSVRKFSPEDLKKVKRVVNNPKAFLHTK